VSFVQFSNLVQQFVSLPVSKLDVLNVSTAGTVLLGTVVTEVRLDGIGAE